MDWELRFELNEDDRWTCIMGLQNYVIKDCGKTIEKALQNTMLQLSQQGLDSFMDWCRKSNFTVHNPCNHCTMKDSVYCYYNCRELLVY